MAKFKHWYENIIHLPTVNQTHSYDCGAAALRAIALYYGIGPEREGDFIKACDTSKELGTDPVDLVKAAQNMGLHAKRFENMSLEKLCHFIDAKKPVICAIQAHGEDDEDYADLKVGHYVVVIGYTEQWILFEDPFVRGQKSRGRMSLDEFVTKWIDLDRKKKTLYHLGIVVWSDSLPKKEEKVLQTKEVK